MKLKEANWCSTYLAWCRQLQFIILQHTVAGKEQNEAFVEMTENVWKTQNICTVNCLILGHFDRRWFLGPGGCRKTPIVCQTAQMNGNWQLTPELHKTPYWNFLAGIDTRSHKAGSAENRKLVNEECRKTKRLQCM